MKNGENRGYILGCYYDKSNIIKYLADPMETAGYSATWTSNPQNALIFTDIKNINQYINTRHRGKRKRKRKQLFISKCWYINKSYQKRYQNPYYRNTFVRFTKINAYQMLVGIMKM